MKVVSNEFSQCFSWVSNSLGQALSSFMSFFVWFMVSYLVICIPFVAILIAVGPYSGMAKPIMFISSIVFSFYYVGLYNVVRNVANGNGVCLSQFFMIYTQFDIWAKVIVYSIIEFIVFVVIGTIFFLIYMQVSHGLAIFLMLTVGLYVYFASLIALSLIFKEREVGAIQAILLSIVATFKNILPLFGLLVCAAIVTIVFGGVAAVMINIVARSHSILFMIISIVFGGALYSALILFYFLSIFNATDDMVNDNLYIDED